MRILFTCIPQTGRAPGPEKPSGKSAPWAADRKRRSNDTALASPRRNAPALLD
jgi:hypothetical protein